MSYGGGKTISEDLTVKEFINLFKNQGEFGKISEFIYTKFIYPERYGVIFFPDREKGNSFCTGDNFTLYFDNQESADLILNKLLNKLKKTYNLDGGKENWVTMDHEPSLGFYDLMSVMILFKQEEKKKNKEKQK